MFPINLLQIVWHLFKWTVENHKLNVHSLPLAAHIILSSTSARLVPTLAETPRVYDSNGCSALIDSLKKFFISLAWFPVRGELQSSSLELGRSPKLLQKLLERVPVRSFAKGGPSIGTLLLAVSRTDMHNAIINALINLSVVVYSHALVVVQTRCHHIKLFTLTVSAPSHQR